MRKLTFIGIALSLLLALVMWQQKHIAAAKAAYAAAPASAPNEVKPHEPMPSLQGQPAIDYLRERGLFESIKAAVEAGRHEIQWLPEAGRPGSGGAWQANNPGQNLRASFSRAGAVITPRQSCAGASWQVALKLRGIGYGERLSKVVSGPLRAAGNRVEISQTAITLSTSGSQSAITEWYVNKAEGIEQGFTLAGRPGESRGNEPLRVALTVTGGLRASVEDGGQAVALAYRDGRKALRYDHVAAYDAFGRALPARMEVSGGEISLLVDDANAVYPVTIDPLFTEVKKLTASDGTSGDQFGSVALSGDTAIVGAFADDSGKGAAYVFERNRGGADLWGEVKKLTASDGVAGDLFGRSVALSGDTAIVGANGDDSFKGAAYIFGRNQGGADLWGEVKKLTASDGAASDQFGRSVALSGDTAIVGAPVDDSGKGAAYVFGRNQGGADLWGEVKKLTASDGVASDFFGGSLALSGDTAIVGADGDDGNKGAAYIFERNQGGADLWGQVKKLTASDGVAGDLFGASVALSGDTAIVGAYGDDSNKGAAYVFERNQGGADLWGQVKKLTASDGAAHDQFGFSVALSGDTAIVGAYEDDSFKGAAYVFERNQGGADLWGQVKKLTASDGAANDQFGRSVALSGDTAIVGAYGDDSFKGAAYIFASDCNWAEKRKPVASDGAATDQFGVSVSISGDTVIVGAYSDDGLKGAAYIFERNQGGADLWGEVKKLTASDGVAFDQFGGSVALSGDTAIVGAFRDDSAKGAAYVFERNQGGADLWGEVKKLTASDGVANDQFGTSVALSGDTAIVGAPNDDSDKGAAYVFERNQGGADLWGEVKKLTASDRAVLDRFGNSVALSGDTAIVGANRDDSAKGSAYVFERNQGGADLWGQVRKLTASDGAPNDNFGLAVALSSDTAIVGAYRDDSVKGAAYVFERNQGGADLWGEVKKLTASDGAAGDAFGFSVALSGDTAIGGAFADDSNKGSAYVFERNQGGADLWGEVKKLTASDGAAGDVFGWSVALSGDTAIVGAEGDDSAKGSSYIFVCEAPQITAIGPARLWLGLKNSDDVGTNFDLLAEVFKNSELTPIASSGVIPNVPGGGSGFNNAVLRIISLTLAGSPSINAGDTLRFRLSVRIAAASGHRSGTARLWYNGASIDTGATRDAGSRFNATIGSNPPTDYFLRSGIGFPLNTTAGTSKQFVDVFVDRAVGGNPFKPFGTWSKTFP